MQICWVTQRDFKDKYSTLIFTHCSFPWLLKAVTKKGVTRRKELGLKRAGCGASRSLSTPTESVTEQNPSYFKTSTTPRNPFWDSFRISARQIGNALHHKYSRMTKVNPEGDRRREPLVSHVARSRHVLTYGHHLHQVLFFCLGKKKKRKRAQNSDVWSNWGSLEETPKPHRIQHRHNRQN